MMSVARPRVATVWLGGCSGCHMSFLDMDERLLDIAAAADLVFSPILDVKIFPENVDIALVEGAVANTDHEETIRRVRERSKVLVAFGDCAVSGNVTALRNPLGTADSVLRRVYMDDALTTPCMPMTEGIVPRLLDRVRTVADCVPVDHYLPGCPPSADLIHYVLAELVAGRPLDLRNRARLG